MVRDRGLGLSAVEALAALELNASAAAVDAFTRARSELSLLVRHDPLVGAQLVRLAYHDRSGAEAQRALQQLAPIYARYPELSRPDFEQFAAAVAVEALGGPALAFRYGRREGEAVGEAAGAVAGLSGADYLRAVVLERLGCSERELVALLGAHVLLASGARLDHAYFARLLGHTWTEVSDGSGAFEDEARQWRLSASDVALLTDAALKAHVERYARNGDLWLQDFATAFQRLQERGHRGLRPLHLHVALER